MKGLDPKRRFMSFVYAAKGFRWAFATQANLWIHSLAAVLVVVAGFYVHLTHVEWALLAFTIASVFAAEFFNTAIEWIVDSIYKEQHPLAGKIKDVSAAAVLVIALGAVAVGVCIFYPHVVHLLENNA